MSKIKLKKYLLLLTKEQITEIVLELYDARKEAKDYLEFYLAPDCDAKLRESKKTIEREFFLLVGFPRTHPLPSVGRSSLTFRSSNQSRLLSLT